MAKVEIHINDRDFRRKLNRLDGVTKNTKELKAVLRKAAQPWAKAANSAVYRYVERRTGNLGKAIGIGTFQSERRGQVGVKARPKSSSRGGERNGGWRAHFFASPARQISPNKRIPWSTIYDSQNPKVIANVVSGVKALFRKYGI